MRKYLFILLLFPFYSFAQGLINNGAYIVVSNGSNIYIDGATGNYTNTNSGLISNSSAGSTITILGNWINNGGNAAFNNDGATVRFSGATQSIGGSNSSTFYNVNLVGSGAKTLNINTSVGGISTLTGVLSIGTQLLDLNGYTLTIRNPLPGAITFSSGYIQSETNTAINPSIIQWNMGTSTGAHVYPFGLAATQIPFTFNKTSAGASNIAISTRATAANSNIPWAGASNVGAVSSMLSITPPVYPDASIPSVIDRWWDITASAAVTADLIFTYRGSENTTTLAPTGTFSAQHWNGSSWDAPTGTGTGVTTGVGTVSVSGANTFSPWVLSSNLAPLPIELLNFEGICENEKVVLKWSTSSETNNDFFTIEKSYDGFLFTAIGTVNGADNSTNVINYSLTDNSSTNEMAYYRLKQTDYNGQTKTYEIISVEGCGNNSVAINSFNSGDGNLSISIKDVSTNQYTLKIYDAVGKLMNSKTMSTEKGFNNYTIDVSTLTWGIYFISVENDKQKHINKLLINEQ